MIRGRPMILLAAALSLGGCVDALLGGAKRVQLYRLDGQAPPPVAAMARDAVPGRAILLLPVRFAPEIDGDRLLTVRGRTALYIRDARWVAPTPDLFAREMEHIFAVQAPNILLTSARQPSAAHHALQVTIDTFEASYAEGAPAEAAPLIRIEGEARLISTTDRRVMAVRRFVATAPASENRVGAIVAAFATATDVYLGQLAGWTSSATMAQP